jgi:exosome complex RNA-binding protein Rrp42 (RNase PH superfamily)
LAERPTKLALPHKSIAVTCSIFDEVFIVDPSEDEEKVARGTLTCAFDEEGTITFMEHVRFRNTVNHHHHHANIIF